VTHGYRGKLLTSWWLFKILYIIPTYKSSVDPRFGVGWIVDGQCSEISEFKTSRTYSLLLIRTADGEFSLFLFYIEDLWDEVIENVTSTGFFISFSLRKLKNNENSVIFFLSVRSFNFDEIGYSNEKNKSNYLFCCN